MSVVVRVGGCAPPLALIVALVAGLPASAGGEKAAAGAAPKAPACPIPNGWKAPADVGPVDPSDPFAAFDAFSWDTFIALNWPAKPGQRGVPDTAGCIGGKAAAVVWETFGSADTLFQQNPPPWAPQTLAAVANFNDSELNTTKRLQRFSKVGQRGTAGLKAALPKLKAALQQDFDFNEAFGGPVIDQHNNYAVFEVRFDKAAYTFVYDGKYYLRANLPLPPAGFTNGSTIVKAGWRIMTPADLARKPVRYYVAPAMVYDPDTKKQVLRQLGLVGFHITVKTPSRPQWIWATFEQVDNVATTVPGLTPSFNNGTPNPPTPKGFDYEPKAIGNPPIFPPPGDRKPVQVTRIAGAAIPPSTVATNTKYQAKLKGTPFEFYELAHSQWPSDPKNVAKFGVPFPANGATNTVLETYLQSSSCMGCHAGAQSSGTDFSWTLFDDAVPPPKSP